MPFDASAARKAGYSDDEILQHLTQSRKFDVGGAVKSGYSKQEIIDHLSKSPAPSPSPQTNAQALTQGVSESFHPVDAVVDLGGKAVNAVLHPIDTANSVVSELKNRYNPDSSENKAGSDEANRLFDLNGADADKYVAKKLGNKIGNAGEQAVIAAATYGAGKLLGTASKSIPRGTGKTIGEKIGEASKDLDAAGTTPDARKIIQQIDDLRSKNMTPGGTVLNEAKESRLLKARDQILNEVTSPNNPAPFSGLSKIKTELQKEAASSGFFDGADAKASAKAAGEASREVRAILRDTSGAEAWSKLEDSAAFRHRIDSAVEKAGAAIGGATGAGKGLIGGPVGAAVGLPVGAKLGAKIGRSLSEAITSGKLMKASAPIRNSIADMMTAGDYVTADKVAAGLLATRNNRK